jgi:hypothetical protein
MSSGRTIKVYLADGLPDGLRTAEIINWTGKVIVVARAQLSALASRSEAQRTGIYMLVGDDPNNPNQERVYVGESDNVYKRLTQHDGDDKKDFWTRTVVVISKDENLTKAHVRYLESRLISLGSQAGRAMMDNGTAPPLPSLPESDVTDMEFFLNQVQTLLPVLGFPFVQPLPTISSPIPTAPVNTPTPSPLSPIFTLSTTDGVQAEAQEVGSAFIVRANSTARASATQALGTTYQRLRDDLRATGKLQDDLQSNLWVFAADVPFDSPSAAAAVINGYNVNGRKYWKLQGSTLTYGDWKQQQNTAEPSLAVGNQNGTLVAALDQDE